MDRIRARSRGPPDEEEVVLVITATTTSSYSHDCDHGFCVICGSVWPCSRSRRATAQPPRIPVARPEYFDY
jgi:hypothetical protein